MSKFSGLSKTLKEAKQQQPPENEPENLEGDAEPKNNDEVLDIPNDPPVLGTKTIQQTEQPKRGRPKGKRSNPDFEQVTAYIRKETYRKIKIALLQEEERREFSELLEDLLNEYLKR